MPAYANAPCFANYDQSEEAPDAAVVVPGLVNHALGHPRNSFTYGTALTEILVRCAFSTRLYHSMPFGVRLLQAAGPVMRKGDVRRQLGTSTNTADQIQTYNGGFERNDGTKSGTCQQFSNSRAGGRGQAMLSRARQEHPKLNVEAMGTRWLHRSSLSLQRSLRVMVHTVRREQNVFEHTL